MWVAGHSLRDLRHLLRASSWQSSFLEAAWPPFFLGIAGCRGMPGATPPHPPVLLCQGTVFLSHREELAGAFWHDDQGSSCTSVPWGTYK